MIISVENAKFVDHLVIIVLTYSCLEIFMPRENVLDEDFAFNCFPRI